MNMAALKSLCRKMGCVYREQEPMRLHTSFKIGGPADLFLLPNGEEELAVLLPVARELDVPVHIMGKGTDLLVSDEGIRGVVVAVTERLSRMQVGEDGVSISCDAGASLDMLCRFAQQRGLTGLEFAYGIPGSVGGAVYMNAGAYGGEMKDVLVSTAHITPGGERGGLQGDEMELDYRHSAYVHGGGCIVRATVRLRPGDRDQILQQMTQLKARRKEKQPLEFPSAGSTFKRPAGNYASALIDACGLKGMRVGDAMVSEKHAGFLINCGEATCAQMLELIRHVQETVFKETGYRLECEVKMM